MIKLIVALYIGVAFVFLGLARDYEKMTGDDIVRGNAQKENGYTEAQLQNISEALKGKTLTFHNGKVSHVFKYEDNDSMLQGELRGSVFLRVVFAVPDDGRYHPTLEVDVRVPSSRAKDVQDLDEGAEVKEVMGVVHYDADFFTRFELRNAVLTSAKTSVHVDYSMMSGDDIVSGNAQKETGYSTAQLQNISKALKGKELTFHNGEVSKVSKDGKDGSVVVRVEFDAPDGRRFAPSFDLEARVPAIKAKNVEDLDEGARIKELKGTVIYNEGCFRGFELTNASLFGL